jgi:hypothetical protein
MRNLIKRFREKFQSDLMARFDTLTARMDELNKDPPLPFQGAFQGVPSNLFGLSLPKDKMPNCRVLPSRDDVLDLLPKGGIVAELGVAFGDFSEKIFSKLSPKEFYAIDVFWLKQGDILMGRNDFQESNMNQYDYIHNRFKKEIKEGRFFIKQGYSWDSLSQFDNDYFDYIYVDAGHDYESVSKDISVILQKIKNNGIVQFNDYLLFNEAGCMPYGVVRAVDELLLSGNHEMIYFALQNAGFHDVVLKIKKY